MNIENTVIKSFTMKFFLKMLFELRKSVPQCENYITVYIA